MVDELYKLYVPSLHPQLLSHSHIMFLSFLCLVDVHQWRGKKLRPDDFLSVVSPTQEGEDDGDDGKMVRLVSPYSNTSSRFKIKKRSYEEQYCGVYMYRLMRMRPVLQQKAESTWLKHKTQEEGMKN